MQKREKLSLNKILDSLAEDLFFGKRTVLKNHSEAVNWICERQGLPGSYAGMFAPTDADSAGIRLFTGERVTTHAGIGHQLGEEACRLLNLLKHENPEAVTALEHARSGMVARLEEAEARGQSTTVYCCGTCTPAYWRNLATGLFPKAEERLTDGMKQLGELHADDGQWKRFPFYFTCLALTEIAPALSQGEIRHAATRWERILPRLSRSTTAYDIRRAELGRRVLGMA